MKKTILLMLILSICSLGYAQNNSNEYKTPVDGRTYVAPGGWEEYSPEGPPRKAKGNIQLKELIFLTDYNEVFKYTTVNDIAKFINETEFNVEEAFKKYSQSAVLFIQYNCKPSEHEVQISSQGEVPKELLQKLHDKLLKISNLNTKGAVSFQVQCMINP